MKYIFIVLLFAACTSKPGKEIVRDTMIIRDTVYLPELPPQFDTVYMASVAIHKDSIRLLKDTINARTKRLNIATYKLQKIDYYVKIVDSKPSQITFLKGWIKRALRG